jgi:hypothetical protein
MEVISLENGTLLRDIVGLVSRKRKAVMARPTTAVTLSGTYWDSGSRDSYYLVNLVTRGVVPLEHQSPMQFGGPRQGPQQLLEPGYAVIQAGVFCGKPATPVVYLHPEETLIQM